MQMGMQTGYDANNGATFGSAAYNPTGGNFGNPNAFGVSWQTLSAHERSPAAHMAPYTPPTRRPTPHPTNSPNNPGAAGVALRQLLTNNRL